VRRVLQQKVSATLKGGFELVLTGMYTVHSSRSDLRTSRQV